MRLVLRAAFDRYSGYGNDGVDLAINLQKAGLDVLPWPMGLRPGLPRDFTRLLEKDPGGHKDVVMTFAPPFEIRPWEFASLAGKAVGYSMWEWSPLLDSDFDGHGWEAWPDIGGDRWRGLDAMFVTCPMNVEAFGAQTEIPRPVIPCGIESDDWPVKTRSTETRMQFLMIGMLAGRKVPFVMLEAWKALKEEHPEFDAVLRLHTLAPGLHPAIMDVYPDVVLTGHYLTRSELVALYHQSDVLVSVSRGEGNNKPAKEFMATGGTVIASDWGGHQNWLQRDVAYAVPGVVEPDPKRPDSGAMNFDVDVEVLKQHLYTAWRKRGDTVRRGERAAKWIREVAGWDVVAAQFVKRLADL